MKPPYQLILDVWEADSDLDVPTLLDNGVSAIICRLNDMSGGHHPDALFPKLWAQALQFPTQSIYFVYNPWVNGPANFNWLQQHLPNPYTGRVHWDIEVAYPNYSPDTYASEVANAIASSKAFWPTDIYTGAWFLNNVSNWPKDVNYWWAAYPNILNTGETLTWDAFRAKVELCLFAFTGATCPGGMGNIKLWQCSGGGVWMPGFGSHKVDVSVFPGTLDDLKAWMPPVSKTPPPAPVDPMQAQIDLLNKHATELHASAVQQNSIADDLTAIAKALGK